MKHFLLIFFIFSYSLNFQLHSQSPVPHDLISSKCALMSPPPADTLFYNFSGDTLNIQLIKFGHACQKPVSSIELFSDTLKFSIQDTTTSFCLWDCSYWYNFRLYGMSDTNYIVQLENKIYYINRFYPTRYPYFAPIGARWYYSASAQGRAPARSEFYLYESVKDTLIAGQTCKKLDITYYRYLGDSVKMDPLYVYSTEKKVYYYNAQYDSFLKLYDFSASVGDTVDFYAPDTSLLSTSADSTFQVVIDSISMVSGNKEMLDFFHSSYDPMERWSYYGGYIEKIGSVYMMLPRPTTQIPEADGPLRCYVYGNFTKNFTNRPCNYRIVGLNELQKDKNIRIFPNPVSTSAKLQLQLEQNIKIIEIKLYNSLGQLIKEFGTSERALDFSKIGKGKYFISIKTDDETITEKIIVN